MGPMISAHELKARWAYSEMASSRWGRHFVQQHPALMRKANSGVPFANLGAREHDELVQALPLARHPAFIASIDQCAAQYEFQRWSKGQLCHAWALPAFNPPAKIQPIPYYDFFIRRPDTGPGGQPEDTDPRVTYARAAIAFNPHHEAVIVVGQPGHYVLLEGTLRSVIFMNSAGNSQRLNVWVPVP
jgi:hypothetical protein